MLTTYNLQTHADCSEAFYRNELESDIQSAPSKTAEERMQILELLKRFEEGNEEGGASELELDGVDGAGDEDGPFPSDSGSSDLAARLGNLDLGKSVPCCRRCVTNADSQIPLRQMICGLSLPPRSASDSLKRSRTHRASLRRRSSRVQSLSSTERNHGGMLRRLISKAPQKLPLFALLLLLPLFSRARQRSTANNQRPWKYLLA